MLLKVKRVALLWGKAMTNEGVALDREILRAPGEQVCACPRAVRVAKEAHTLTSYGALNARRLVRCNVGAIPEGLRHAHRQAYQTLRVARVGLHGAVGNSKGTYRTHRHRRNVARCRGSNGEVGVKSSHLLLHVIRTIKSRQVVDARGVERH